MVTRSMFVVIVIAMLLTGLVPVASAQPPVPVTPSHVEGIEWACKPTNIVSTPNAPFQYLEDMNLLIILHLGEVIFYDLNYYEFNVPGDHSEDSYEVSMLFTLTKGSVEGEQLQSFAVMPTGKDSGILALDFADRFHAIRFTLGDGFLFEEGERSFPWKDGTVWSDGITIYLRDRSVEDYEIYKDSELNLLNDEIHLNEPYKPPTNIFQKYQPWHVPAEWSRFEQGNVIYEPFSPWPELMAANEELKVVRGINTVALCPKQQPSPTTESYSNQIRTPAKNEELENLYIK